MKTLLYESFRKAIMMTVYRAAPDLLKMTDLSSIKSANCPKRLDLYSRQPCSRMYPRKVLPKRHRHNRIEELTPLLHVGADVASICRLKGYLSSQH